MTSAAPVVKRRKGQGRDSLIAAARRLFGERGFDAVSTKELALEAGLTIGALYHHFPGKEAIYCAALEEALAALPPAPVAEAKGLAPRDALDLLVGWHSATVMREPLVRRELLDPHLDVPLMELPIFHDALTLFRLLMPIGAPGMDPALALSAIVSLSFGFTSLKGIRAGFDPPQDMSSLARLITHIVLGGKPG